MGTPAHAAPFGAKSSRRLLSEACSQVGLDSHEAEMLRLGENALFRLADNKTVVRIARTMDYWDDAKKEVHVARWLASQDFPAVKVTELPQPIEVREHPVTFWEYVDGRDGSRTDIAELGKLLRRLHRMAPPSGFKLPTEDILGRVEPRIKAANVSTADKDFLLHRCETLRRDQAGLTFPLAPTPTHGDAHIKNIMVRDGQTLLIDFERFAWGQPEWDLSMTATEYRSAGWWTDDEYARFVDTYGYDITEWSAFGILRATHEIKMTTWIMQNAHESAEIAAEYETRMRTIRFGELTGKWKPF